MHRGSLPPLAATGPLGAPGTTVLLDHAGFDDGERLGIRGTLGLWLEPSQTCGIEANYLQLFQRNPGFAATSPGTPSLGVPFFNVATGAEDIFPVASPGGPSGRIEVEEVSRLWSAEANLRCALCRSCWHQLDLLAGFRFLGFDEDLTLTDTTTQPARQSVALSDRFTTRNLFFGGQLGAEAEARWAHWSGDLWAKVALGDNRETVNISGTTLMTTPAGAQTALPGGLFALPTNIGQYTRDQFSFIPEFGMHLGYQVNHHLRLFAGYDILYLGNVVRPGDQMDRGINPTQAAIGAANAPGLTGPARPLFTFHETDTWAQGVTLGFEFRY
jgi:hypothetical protein